MESKNKNITRRSFIKKTSIFGSGVLTAKYLHLENSNPLAKDIKMKYRILGRSGIKVSEVGLGTWEAPNPNVLDYALERGINYIDTAPEYKQGEEERMIGKAVKGKRDKAVIASKIFTTHESTKNETMKLIDELLKRMQTDYVDILLIYQIGEVIPKHGLIKGKEWARLKNENVIEAYNQAKKDGKVRAIGISSHGGDLPGYMNHAIDSGIFDIIMLKYNFMAFPQEREILEKAKQKNVGSVAFKIAGGAYDQKIEGYKKSRTPEFRRAAIKWVLSNPNVTTCILRMPTFDEVDNCLKAVDEKFGYFDRQMLERYATEVRPYYCRWCNTCTHACPYEVAIPEIQRYLMYYTNFLHKKEAVRKYADLLPYQKAHRCIECSAPCEKICPNNIPIKEILTEANKTLSYLV